MYEYHTHTTNSADSHVKMHEYCERAIANGIQEIAFTDHIDHDPADRSRGHNKYPAYMADVAACRATYSDRLTILAAAEVDWNRQTADAVRATLAETAFDFIICSVHWINGEYLGVRATKQPSHEVYRQYLDEVEALVTTEDFFHVIGHFDLGKRYDTVNGRIDLEHNGAQLGRIFAAMAAHDKGFDLNTSAVRTAAKEPMPAQIFCASSALTAASTSPLAPIRTCLRPSGRISMLRCKPCAMPVGRPQATSKTDSSCRFRSIRC